MLPGALSFGVVVGFYLLCESPSGRKRLQKNFYDYSCRILKAKKEHFQLALLFLQNKYLSLNHRPWDSPNSSPHLILIHDSKLWVLSFWLWGIKSINKIDVAKIQKTSDFQIKGPLLDPFSYGQTGTVSIRRHVLNTH